MNSTENRKPETENPAVRQDDKPRGHCGVFGIHGHPDAARLTCFGLYAPEKSRVRPGPGQR